MEKNKSFKKGIIINVDFKTYEDLISEQRTYYRNIRKKISLANIILHYYKIGFSKADKSLYSGLRIIESQKDDHKVDNKKELSGINPTEGLSKSMLALMKNTENRLKAKEDQLIKREENIIERLLKNNNSVDYNMLNQFKAEFARVNVELAFLKDELNSRKKDNEDLRIRENLKKIEKSLTIIEQQTKKSALESI